MRKLKINHSTFQNAFSLSDYDSEAYLDRETSQVIILDDYIRTLFEKYMVEGKDLDSVLAKLQADTTLNDSEREILIPVARIEFAEDVERYETIPKQDSREGYRDMQEYIWSLEDEHLRELLEVAIHGSGAFRRFKDVLIRYPDARTAWFQFQDERERRRMTGWLAAIGIEVEFE